MAEIVGVLFDNIIGFDLIILGFAVLNIFVYKNTKKRTDRIYQHFNKQDKVTNLSDEQKEKLINNTKDIDTKLTPEQLLENREKMNKSYAMYTNFTTMFPLLGMLGTVVSLIPMVDKIGEQASGLFFTALTSTFWGIVAALIFKALDSTISYKIEDNEKHIEYILVEKINRR